MEYIEKIKKEELEAHLNGLCGIQINHVWLGYMNALFLECGKLTKDKKRENPQGQISFMLEGDWRIENARSISLGRFSKEKRLEKQIKTLIGLKIKSISLVNRIPELLIELESGQYIQTFTGWDTNPQWFVGFLDSCKAVVHPEWKKEDVSIWLSFERGGYRRSYCFDDEVFRNKKFLREYCK